MPTFDFQHMASGERIERVFPIGRAPKSVRVGRRTFKRVPSVPLVQVAQDIHFVSDQLPLHWTAARDHDEQGRPRFSSRREIDEAVARARHNGEHVTYGTCPEGSASAGGLAD
jgi:hypothetical protein